MVINLFTLWSNGKVCKSGAKSPIVNHLIVGIIIVSLQKFWRHTCIRFYSSNHIEEPPFDVISMYTLSKVKPNVVHMQQSESKISFYTQCLLANIQMLVNLRA